MGKSLILSEKLIYRVKNTSIQYKSNFNYKMLKLFLKQNTKLASEIEMQIREFYNINIENKDKKS